MICFHCPDILHVASGPNRGQTNLLWICSSTFKQLHIFWDVQGPSGQIPLLALSYLPRSGLFGQRDFLAVVRPYLEHVLCVGEWCQHGPSQRAGASVGGCSVIPRLKWAGTYAYKRGWWRLDRAGCEESQVLTVAHPSGWGGQQRIQMQGGYHTCLNCSAERGGCPSWGGLCSTGGRLGPSLTHSVAGKLLSRVKYKKPK